MNTLPKKAFGILPQLVQAFLIPAFFLIWVFGYEPRSLALLLGTGSQYDPGGGILPFNATIIAAILFLSMVILRLVFYFLRNLWRRSLVSLILWCVFEIVFMAAFMGLYLDLMSTHEMNYFHYWGVCIKEIAAFAVYPYALMILICQVVFSDSDKAGSDDRLRFYDSRHQLKFVTSPSSILYIESNENYIIIRYSENGNVKQYQIRSSMKSIEEMCQKAGFVRTHRRYIVNPNHVTLIRKDEMGMFYADLDAGLGSGIPVSKSYYSQITSAL